MLMALVPTAFAASTPPDFSDGWTALTSADGGQILNGGNYYLDDDVTIELGIDFIGTVVLDLNGHVLNLDKTRYSGTDDLPVINVYNTDETSTDFTLQDSNPTAKHYFSKQADGLWKWEPTVTEATEGYELVEGGVITGGDTTYGGGVILCELFRKNSFVANLNGGNIVGCKAEYGGGIYSSTHYTASALNGVNIIGCVAEYLGGGICNFQNSRVILNGGKIIGCRAKAGGGIYNCYNLTINDVSIEDCVANIYGGGIFSGGDSSSFTMNNGKIENCVVTEYGGGACNQAGSFKMTGGSIKNCTATNNSNSNAYSSLSNGIFYADGGVIDGTAYFGTRCNIKRSDDAKGTTVFNEKVTYGGNVYTGIFYGDLYSESTKYSVIIGNTYTVDFFENDTDTEPFAAAFIVGDGTKLVPPTAPTKTGYTFDAWYTEGGDEYKFDSAVASDFSLYAEYTHTDHADTDGDGLCDACGEAVPTTVPTEPTEPTTPTVEKTLEDYIINVVYEALMALVRIIINAVKSYI